MALRVWMETEGHKVIKASTELLVIKGIKEKMVLGDFKVIRVLKDIKELKDFMGHKV